MRSRENMVTERANEAVRQYFDRSAARFDLIYHQDKGPVQRLVDSLFRRVIHHRFRLVLERCGDVAGKRVLDIGCGSGRYAVAFAQRGAHVVGLDLSATMVRMATEAALTARVDDRCRFEQTDFLTWRAEAPFDIGLAIGFFDYVAPASLFVEHLANQVQGRVFCSFPARWTLRTPPRWLRLRLNGCPVHFFSYQQTRALFLADRWPVCRVDRLSRDFLVEAHSG